MARPERGHARQRSYREKPEQQATFRPAELESAATKHGLAEQSDERQAGNDLGRVYQFQRRPKHRQIQIQEGHEYQQEPIRTRSTLAFGAPLAKADLRGSKSTDRRNLRCFD